MYSKHTLVDGNASTAFAEFDELPDDAPEDLSSVSFGGLARQEKSCVHCIRRLASGCTTAMGLFARFCHGQSLFPIALVQLGRYRGNNHQRGVRRLFLAVRAVQAC